MRRVRSVYFSSVLAMSPVLAACGSDEGSTPAPAAGGNAGGGGSAGSVSTGGSAGADGGVSGECTLSLLASGEFPGPSYSLGFPEIVATNDGFVVAYRSQESATIQANMFFISDAGVTDGGTAVVLPECLGSQGREGVGLGFDGAEGLLVAGVSACSAPPGFALTPFDSHGQSSGTTTVANDLDGLIPLPLARGRTQGEYDLLSAGGGTIQKSVVRASGLEGPAETLASGLDFAEIASSTGIRAVYGLAEDSNATEVRVDANQSDSFEPVDTLSLPSAYFFVPGVVAWNNRVAAAVTEPTAVSWTAAELVGNELTTIAGGALPRGSVTPLALAVLGDRLLLAAAAGPELELNLFEGATGELASTPARKAIVAPSYAFGNDLVMAAARGRIAIAWVAHVEQPTGGPTGGWALLSCGD